MYRLICCAWFLCSVSSASAALVNTLKGPGNVSTVNVPLAGGSYDISVNLTRTAADPELSGFQFRLIADTAGFATLLSAGSQCNIAEWNSCSMVPGPLSPSPSGLIGAQYNGVWSTTSSLFGTLNISMGPGTLGQTVLVSPVDNLGADPNTFEDVPGLGVGVTFQYVPEPASALLMGMGLVVAVTHKRRSHR